MRIVIFCHSLISDWNHGNAHFLRGVASELVNRGCEVDVYEPHDAWSVQNLLREDGCAPPLAFHTVYPHLKSIRYRLDRLDLDRELDGADMVLVHEWNDPVLVRRIGEHRAEYDHYRLLFHDTHHRSVTDPTAMAEYDLKHYDGVLAYGKVIRDLYLKRRWARRAWTWHEAADVRVFRPLKEEAHVGDLVWIGNWGDEERTRELHEFLLGPVQTLGLRARVYGVRYPNKVLRALADAGIHYGGWLPNYEAPRVFARYKVTVHVPRRPYVEALRGIPTIRPFEAMACGIPLVSSPWQDSERLFRPGKDFLFAQDGAEMVRRLETLLGDERRRQAQAEAGRETILALHTCAHRVDELMAVHESLVAPARSFSIPTASPLEAAV